MYRILWGELVRGTAGHPYSAIRQSLARTSRSIVVMAVVVFACIAAYGQAVKVEPVDRANGAQPSPVGQFFEIKSPVDDTVSAAVRRATLALKNRVDNERRRGVLVLRISAGASEFHHVRALAKFLSQEMNGITTIGWVPTSLRGNNAVLALACNEIILGPDSGIGDIGRGKALDADEQSFVLGLSVARRNPKLSEGLALGMIDPAKEVIWARVATGERPNQVTETRVVSTTEFDKMLERRETILKHETIKAAGSEGFFSTDKCRAYDIAATHFAKSLDEIAALHKLSPESLSEPVTSAGTPVPMLIKIDQVIDVGAEQFVQRQIQRSLAAGANLLIFEIGSSAGEFASVAGIAATIAEIDSRTVRTVAYLPQHVTSSSVLLAYACDDIVFHTEATLGKAIPDEARPGGANFADAEATITAMREQLQDLARKRSRSAAIADALVRSQKPVFEATHKERGDKSYFIDDDPELVDGSWVKGAPIPGTGRGESLVLSAQRAHQMKVALEPVRDFDEAKTRVGIPPGTAVPVSQKTWVDTVVAILNSGPVTAMLFAVGILLIYMEVHYPFGLFGIGSITCFAVFFWSRFLGGTAGSLEVVLFLLGAAFIAIEWFVIPGTTVFGFAGAMLVLASLVLATQTFIIPRTVNEFTSVSESILTVAGAVLAVAVVGAVIGRYLPRVPIFDRMVLQPPGDGEVESDAPRLDPAVATDSSHAHSAASANSELIGAVGLATTPLRPAGKARLQGRTIDVISDGEFIPNGREVEVVSVDTHKVVVKMRRLGH